MKKKLMIFMLFTFAFSLFAQTALVDSFTIAGIGFRNAEKESFSDKVRNWCYSYESGKNLEGKTFGGFRLKGLIPEYTENKIYRLRFYFEERLSSSDVEALANVLINKYNFRITERFQESYTLLSPDKTLELYVCGAWVDMENKRYLLELDQKKKSNIADDI